MHSTNLGRFFGADPVLMRQTRLVDPQSIGRYVYARNNPLKFVDPLGEDIILANKKARKSFAELVKNGLKAKERDNIRVGKNGKVEIIDPSAIDSSSASKTYSQIESLVSGDQKDKIVTVYTVGNEPIKIDGETYNRSDILEKGGINIDNGDGSYLVVIPEGKGSKVEVTESGVTKKINNTEGSVLAHEALGHTLETNDNDAIDIENDYRDVAGLPLRTGADHQYVVTVQDSLPTELVRSNSKPSLNIVPRPVPKIKPKTKNIRKN